MRLENMSLKQPPSYSRPSNSPGLWKVEDVVLWARQAKLSEAVLAALTENEIDGPTLITLNKGDLRLELGILSLPARRHLWDLVQSLRKEQDARDFKAAIQVHEEEITSFSRATPQEGGAPSTESVIPEQTLLVQELVSDARRESQVVEDHLLALRLQRDLMENTGSSVYRDAEVAQEEQRRLNDLHATAQEDFSFAETLLTPRQRETAAAERRRRHDMSQASTGTIQLAGRFRKSQQRLNEDNSSKGSHEVNRVSSLFGLSMKVCAGNKINVAQAFTSGAMTPIPSAAIVSSSDDEDDRDQKPAAEELPSTHSLPRINTCHVCYIDNVRGYSLACGHLQCISCTRKLFKTTLRDTSLLPLRCCDVPIDMNIAHELLKESEASLVFQRLAEQIAVNKMYCPTCSTFLNLDLIDTSLSQDLTCDCGTQLCIACKTETHPGFTCAENLSAKKGSDELILELSKQKGWKQCPKCSAMIELRSGCNHMTCFFMQASILLCMPKALGR